MSVEVHRSGMETVIKRFWSASDCCNKFQEARNYFNASKTAGVVLFKIDDVLLYREEFFQQPK